jgi:hypothetical protein
LFSLFSFLLALLRKKKKGRDDSDIDYLATLLNQCLVFEGGGGGGGGALA